LPGSHERAGNSVQILFMGVCGVNNRRKNGVLYAIQHTAFTS
jgi:hypothetical protein